MQCRLPRRSKARSRLSAELGHRYASTRLRLDSDARVAELNGAGRRNRPFAFRGGGRLQCPGTSRTSRSRCRPRPGSAGAGLRPLSTWTKWRYRPFGDIRSAELITLKLPDGLESHSEPARQRRASSARRPSRR
jgi:hypothetical protein